MTRDREAPTPGGPPELEPTRFLIARAIEVEKSREKPFGIRLRFKLHHIMWLSVWSALVLAARGPLLASLPEVAAAVAMTSLAMTFAMFVTVFGIALLMEEGETKDRVVLILFYCMAGSSFLFLCLGYFAVAALK